MKERTNLWRWLGTIATLLDPDERQSVLGDIQERGANLRALLDLIGLVALRQLQAWTSWQRWLMAALLALPAIFAGRATHPIAYIARTGHLFRFGTFVLQPWVTLEAVAAAWAIGFTLGCFGQRRSASALPLLIALASWNSYQMARSSLRLELPPTWMTRFQLDFTPAQHIASAVQLLDESHRFIAAVIAMSLLIAIPCIHGWYRGMRQRPLALSFAAVIAVAALAPRGYVVPENVSPLRFSFLLLASAWPIAYTLWAASRSIGFRKSTRVIHNV